MSDATHTPWRTGHDGHGGMFLEDATGDFIGYVANRPGQSKRAALIVTAVNCHADLLAACEAMLAPHQTPETIDAAYTLMRAAVAKARS